MLSREQLQRAAAASGFQVESYEKIHVLVRLLEAVRIHPSHRIGATQDSFAAIHGQAKRRVAANRSPGARSPFGPGGVIWAWWIWCHSSNEMPSGRTTMELKGVLEVGDALIDPICEGRLPEPA